MIDRTINIRNIQHYMYCPRRYALLEINKDWNENAFIVKADIMHEHVHDGSHSFSDSKKIVKSAVAVYSDLPEYDLYGITDCIEFLKSSQGVQISSLEGTYKVRLIEYKPKSPKGEAFHEADAIQVFAQKVCADYVWHCDSEAYIYYSDIKKRVRLPFDEEFDKYNKLLKKLLDEIREIIDKHEIPHRSKGQKCSGCSIADLCFPKNKKYCVKKEINLMSGGEVM